MSEQKWKLERRFDDSLHRDLPEILAKTDTDAVLELACNSFDADAEIIDITYNPEENRFSIDDDGEGMGSLEKLQSFYRRGGSTKRTKRLTAKGRLKIGKFSLAASLLYYLTRRYTLDTKGNGHRATVTENFDETQGGTQVPDPTVSTTVQTEHGTRIELLDLRRRIDLEELVDRVARELPIERDDFTVRINGNRVMMPRIDDAAVFYMDEEIRGVGRVTDQFYLAPTKIPNKGGIYLKVHGRAVGNPMSPFNIGRKSSGKLTERPASAIGMANRVIGFVYADGLDPYIGFDRSGFKEDNPQVIAVQTRIVEFLTTIRRYYDNAVREESRRKKVDGYYRAIETVERRFNRADREFLSRSRCKFEISREEGTGYPVEIDLERDTVTVYTDHPYFNGIRNPAALEASLTAAVSFAMGRKRIEQKLLVEDPTRMDTTFRKAFEIIHLQGNRLSETLFGERQKSALEQPDRIEPTRLYKLEEIARITQLDNETVKNMLEAGLFEEPIKRPVLVSEGITYVEGKSVKNAVKQIEGNKLLVQIIRETFPSLSIDDQLDFVEELAETIAGDRTAQTYTKDIGVLIPFYVVRDDKVAVFKAYLESQGIAATKKRSYGALSEGHRHMFLFSLKVPRKHRADPEAFYRAEMGFLESYQRADGSSRIRAYYLQDQHRVLGTALSFDPALLRRTLEGYEFEHLDSIPREVLDSEAALLKSTQPGRQSFQKLEATPEKYRNLLVLR